MPKKITQKSLLRPKNMYHKAKKSLGQNFLKSDGILNKIVLASELKIDGMTDSPELKKGEEYTVLEIGPGKGALTAKLLQSAKKVIAIEKDEQLFALLSEKFSKEIEEASLIIENTDILDLDTSKSPYFKSPYKIVANIPYNITGAIFKKFLTAENKPKSMTLLVQYEVAKRIMARDGKESLLSISVKAYGTPSMPLKVPARFFSPVPKVDSAVIHIKDISGEFFAKSQGENDTEENFWEVVRAGFAHKRKKLAGNLKNLKDTSLKKEVQEKLLRLKLENARAEDLSVEDWKMLVG
ncbi:MAG: 16S rRNA (adenine(1518)-N(6)/adenine(1519)-N(6))-dimethyltransferase RsmA [Candidatus Pacebacteria bacterium]|nr:16S rRNA (adenine(1518)-N(6)/adenine(1519)-N(6))-dimethyltransferase RsmA [Candidatus Paceibacterota bacterium]MCF7862390.1 16S rRNA (adenine(1518)-N(6)/adenine(1519)-N(6))-dimethyltransferase RsmA [Candidatus Paceibacterota bacterium]